MAPAPLYTADNVEFAYQLNWSLSLFWRSPPDDATWLSALAAATEKDGVRVLEHSFRTPTCSRFLVSTLPSTRPQDVAWSIKGRLQHFIREQSPSAFQRNFDLRGIGSTRRDKAEAYAASQLTHHYPDDAALRATLADLQWSDPEVDLSRPRFSSHARFWGNLHLVFVCNGNRAHRDREWWLRCREMLRRAARKHSHSISRLGILPDHLHMTLGTHPSESPQLVALSYLNNLAYAHDMQPEFMHSGYIATVGEYDLGAVMP